MDFLKKNWGFVLCAIAFLVALGYLLVKTRGYVKEYNQGVASVEEERNWFKTLNSDGYRVKKDANGELENAVLAENNKDLAVGHYNNLISELYRRFCFEPEIPANSTRAGEMLDQKLSQITEMVLVDYKMDFADTIGGKLADINQGTEPLNARDFKPIFRQLMIYDEIVKHLGRAGIKVVTKLDFPRSLQVEEGTGYTITPIVLSVQGDSKTIQTLLNNMTNDRHMLFFIRNLSFYAVNAENPTMEYTQAAVIRKQYLDTKKAERLGGGSTRGGMESGIGGMGGGSTKASARQSRRSSKNSEMDGGSGSRRSSRRSSTRTSGAMGGSMGSDMTAGGMASLLNINEAFLVYEDPKRQDNFIFRTPRELEAEITLDLIEYSAPEETEEAEAESGAEAEVEEE